MKFRLNKQLLVFKEFSMETRLFNIFKITNFMELTKVVLEGFYKVLQVTLKWKATPLLFREY